MPESHYDVLALFTGAMTRASLFIMSTGPLAGFIAPAPSGAVAESHGLANAGVDAL